MIDFKVDLDSEKCLELMVFQEYVMKLKNTPLMMDIPNTVEKYFTKSIKKEARTEWRKAVKNGYEIKKIDEIGIWNDDIVEIWNSQKGRLSRINAEQFIYLGTDFKWLYWKDKWVIQDYGKYSCPKHKLEFWIVVKNNKAVVECEMLKVGNIATVHSFLGHIDHFKYGVMKYCLMEIIKSYIMDGSIKYFSYGYKDFLEDKRSMFVKELGIININKEYKV